MNWVKICNQLICSLEKRNEELSVQYYFHFDGGKGCLTVV